MKIINPLYDTAFKYLMQNKDYAKLLISLIIDKEIEDLAINQQETVAIDEKRNLRMYRLDFKAVIKDKDGQKETVLIELQKSRTYTDIMRFRTYLGNNYTKQERKEEQGIEIKYSLPIITIYILGYELPEIPYMAIEVNHKIIDKRTGQEVEIKSDFIELLNHKSYIIQVKRLPKIRQTKLEYFMTFFNQAYISDKDFILDLENIPEGYEDIARYLNMPLTDEQFINKLLAEDELEYNFELMEKKYYKTLEELEQEKKEKEQERREKEQKEKELEQIKIKSVLKFYDRGITAEEIAETLGFSLEEVNKILRENNKL